MTDDDRPTAGPTDLPPPRPVPAAGPDPGAAALHAGPADAPDRYELTDVGLTGGEGTLYRARYRGGLQNPLEFAVKAMHRPRGADASWPRAEDQRQWQDHTALLRHLSVAHLVRVHEVFAGPPPHRAGAADQRPDVTIAYAAMEWVDGPTLADEVRGRPSRAGNLLTRVGYVADLADAVATLHSATRTGGNPSLHRDVKPTNCIVHPSRGVVLVDVSSMRLLADGFDPDGVHSPGYCAPEVLAAPHLPRRTSCDLYSLGAIMAFCLLGEDPPTAPPGLEPLRSRLSDVARQAGAGRPGELADLVLAMLDADPDRRPADAVAWARRLTAAARPQRRRWVPVAAAAAALGVAAAGVLGLDMLRDGGTRIDLAATDGTAAPTTSVSPALTTAATGSSTVSTSASPTTTATTTSAPRRSTPSRSTAAQKVTSGGSVPSTTSTGPRPPSPPRTSTPAQSTGAFASPAEGADVQACSYFSGTAKVPADVTLILTKRNLDNGDGHRYVEFALGWDQPSATARWRGHQYFGDDDAAVGQRFAIELVAVRRSLVVAADGGTDADADALADKGKVLDTMRVVRVPGGSSDACP